MHTESGMRSNDHENPKKLQGELNETGLIVLWVVYSENTDLGLVVGLRARHYTTVTTVTWSNGSS